MKKRWSALFVAGIVMSAQSGADNIVFDGQALTLEEIAPEWSNMACISIFKETNDEVSQELAQFRS